MTMDFNEFSPRNSLGLSLAISLCILVVACGGGENGVGNTSFAVPISATATTTTQSLTVGTAMASFSPLTPSDGTEPYTYNYVGTLPVGLEFDPGAGIVTGTPLAIYATANLIFSVRDAHNVVASTTSTVSFTVVTPPISAIASTTAQSLTVGAEMANFSPLTPSGGTTPYTFSYVGILPDGLSFDTNTGAVTGTPTATYATANLIFSVQDANNAVASTTSTVSFTVSPAAIISATASTAARHLNVGTTMASFSPLTPSGGTTPYTFSYVGILPDGLSFDANTGAVTGTPTATYATANLIFSVQDANNAVASTTSTVSFTVDTAHVPASTINDTGITASQCFEAGDPLLHPLVACNSAGAIALNVSQDGMSGRDANSATNSDADGKLGYSFTAVTGGCVQDNVTGLMWEVKTTDGGLRDWSNTYTNYDSTASVQIGSGTAATVPTQADIDAATNSVGYMNRVNALGLCGYNDWRIPSADELQSIVDYSVSTVPIAQPTIDTTWFPNTHGWVSPGIGFWTASPIFSYSVEAWGIGFTTGLVVAENRSNPGYVRLVRGGRPLITPRYTYSSDGQEVTDNQSNLVWRRCAEGMVFSGGTCTGTATFFTHEAALQQAESQASITGVDWRLPNINELTSLYDKTLSVPGIDPTVFPGPTGRFWSSTPYVGRYFDAWYVAFGDGYATVSYDFRFATYYVVRLVRDGP